MSLKDVMMAVHAEKHLASKKGKAKPQASKRARNFAPTLKPVDRGGPPPKGKKSDGVRAGGGY